MALVYLHCMLYSASVLLFKLKMLASLLLSQLQTRLYLCHVGVIKNNKDIIKTVAQAYQELSAQMRTMS